MPTQNRSDFENRRSGSTFGSDRRGESRYNDTVEGRQNSIQTKLVDRYTKEQKLIKATAEIKRKAELDAMKLEEREFDKLLAHIKEARTKELLSQRKQELESIGMQKKHEQELLFIRIANLETEASKKRGKAKKLLEAEIADAKKEYAFRNDLIEQNAKQLSSTNRKVAESKAKERLKEKQDLKEINKLADPSTRLRSRTDVESYQAAQPKLMQDLKRAELDLQHASEDGADESTLAKLQELVTIARENLQTNKENLDEATRNNTALDAIRRQPAKSLYEQTQDNLKAKKDAIDRERLSVENAFLDALEIYSSDEATPEEKAQAQADMEQAQLAAEQLNKQEAMYDLVGAGLSEMSKLYKQMLNQVNASMTTLQSYQTSVSTRLQGTDKSYSSIQKLLAKNIGLSPVVKMTNVLQNVNEMLKEGVTYNTEYRAFLMTMSDKIADTFDATSDALLRIVRLQQSDSTAARLGMEASLTRMLNSMYEDSSYLTKSFDTVSSSIVDAISTMTRDQGLEFEYTIQKWFGSLSSLGLSDSTISQLATGLNYMATGDVTALASNSQLQTLMAMSAARAGLDYAELLKSGMGVNDTNALLKSMVTYLKEIAEGDNLVVKSAFGDIYGLEMGDLAAFRNISASEISSIYGKSLTYGSAMSELNNQMRQAVQRTSMAEMLDNVFDNFATDFAEGILSNPATFALWQINSMIKDSTGGINIPFITAFGTGLDLNTDLNSIMQLGVVGLSTLASIPTLLGAIGSVGKFLSGTYGSASGWNAKEYTTRGGVGAVIAGVGSGVSESSYVGSGSASDIKKSTLSGAVEESEETKKTTNKYANLDDEKTSTDIYKAMESKRGMEVLKDEEGNLSLQLASRFGTILKKSGLDTDFMETAVASSITSNLSTESIFQLVELLVSYTQQQGQQLGTLINSVEPVNVNIHSVGTKTSDTSNGNIRIAHSQLDSISVSDGRLHTSVINTPSVNIANVVPIKNEGGTTIRVSGDVTAKLDSASVSALAPNSSNVQNVRVTNTNEFKNMVTISGSGSVGGLASNVSINVEQLFKDLYDLTNDKNRDKDVPLVLPVKIEDVDSSISNGLTVKFPPVPQSYLSEALRKLATSTKI